MQIRNIVYIENVLVKENVEKTIKYLETELNVFDNIPYEALIPTFVNKLSARIYDFVNNACPSNKFLAQRSLYLDYLSHELAYTAENYAKKGGFISKGIGKSLASIAIEIYAAKDSKNEILFYNLKRKS